MNEVMVIFSLAAAGCLVRLSTDLVLQVLARRVSSGTLANGPHHGSPHESQSKADPVVALGLTLTCYGAIALALVSELPGKTSLWFKTRIRFILRSCHQTRRNANYVVKMHEAAF